MDVDSPNLLKRCSSAPLINEATSTTISSPTFNTAPRNTSCFSMFANNEPRTRRFSTSFSPSPQTNNSFGPRLTPRVSQLRQEECADVTNTREVAHECEVHKSLQIGASCEELNLFGLGGNSAPMSPTRINRCSPSVVSPSPTRKTSYTTRRSCSPISIRPPTLSPINRLSSLVTKKRSSENDDTPSAKRCCWSSDGMTRSNPGTPDSDSSLDCTFRPVSPRNQPMSVSQSHIDTASENHKESNRS